MVDYSVPKCPYCKEIWIIQGKDDKYVIKCDCGYANELQPQESKKELIKIWKKIRRYK